MDNYVTDLFHLKLFNHYDYHNYELQMNKGDKLFLYTDGVPEVTDKDEKMFTLDGMVEALNRYKDKTPEGILQGINASVGDFVGDAPQFDDLTMLCVERKSNEGKTLTVDAITENLQNVMTFVDGVLEENRASMKTQMQIDLAVEEIYVNIANDAYGDGIGKAEISAECNDGVITITFKDSGVPYNPLEKEDPDISLPTEEREIGGLGIFLTKKNMDSVAYEYKDGFNILSMTKQI